MEERSSAETLDELERQGWDALSGSDGAAFYERVMADDGLMVFPGVAMDKQGAVSAIRDAVPWQTFELSDIRVVVRDDVGVVAYRAVAQRPGQPRYEALMSSVYVRAGGQWRLLLHQQSPRS